MKFKTPALLLTLACASLMSQAHADCAADATIADTQRAYAKAQQLEPLGNAGEGKRRRFLSPSTRADGYPPASSSGNIAIHATLPR